MKAMRRGTVANIVGALARAVTDAVDANASDAIDQDETAAAALVHLSKYGGENINALRVPLDLSHPGCVRLVDRLEARGLVSRSGAADGRAVAVQLTRRGMADAGAILRRRRAELERALRVLSPREARVFGELASKILRRLVHDEPHALRVCRLCDYGSCPDDVCPVGLAVEAAAAAAGAGE